MTSIKQLPESGKKTRRARLTWIRWLVRSGDLPLSNCGASHKSESLWLDLGRNPVKKLSSSMREVSRYRSLLNRGVAAFESDDPVQVARIAQEVIDIKWHNPFWVGLVSLGLGNLLRRSSFSVIKRLGWTMMGYGAANSAAEGIGWAADIADQVTDIKTKWTGDGKAAPAVPTGGIGQP